jgi:hypothetical protein
MRTITAGAGLLFLVAVFWTSIRLALPAANEHQGKARRAFAIALLALGPGAMFLTAFRGVVDVGQYYVFAVGAPIVVCFLAFHLCCLAVVAVRTPPPYP